MKHPILCSGTTCHGNNVVGFIDLPDGTKPPNPHDIDGYICIECTTTWQNARALPENSNVPAHSLLPLGNYHAQNGRQHRR